MSPGASDDAVRKATGQVWAAWFDALAGAEDGTPRGHKELVAWLEERHADTTTGWWRQMIVNEYEKHTGRRALGETAEAGFQLGASRTIDAPSDRLWAALIAPDGLGRWLGGVAIELREGEEYGTRPGGPGSADGPDQDTAAETAADVAAGDGPGDAGAEPAPFATAGPPHGEVRVVVPGDRVRMTWQPGGWPRPSTLQIRLSDSGTGKTRVSFHHEHLPDADARNAMRTRWKAALAELAEAVS